MPQDPHHDEEATRTVAVSALHAEATLTDPTLTGPACASPGAASPGSGPPHTVLLPGSMLMEYTVESVLGSGGFGITYLARDNHLQCRVAIKEYLPGDLAMRGEGQTVYPKNGAEAAYRLGLERFLAEARVLAGFRHPNIVRVRRFFEANGTAYMVMDYERGVPLRDWVRQQPRLGEEQLLNMFLPLLDGLEVVHRAGVVHRDIKPANIYVREDDGSLVLLDFGAARYAGSFDSRSLTTIVTPGFAPIEQYHTHGAQGPWSDLYALGGVLYWLVTGEKPQEAPARVKHDTMPPAAELARGRYSERLLRAIDWALHPDETERPKAVSQLRAALTGDGTAAPASAAVPPARRRMLLWAGAGVLVTLAVVVFTLSPKTPPAPAASQERVPAADAQARPEAPTDSRPAPAAPPPPAVAEKPRPRPTAAKAERPAAVEPKQARTVPQAETARPAERDGQATAAPAPAAASTATIVLEVRPQAEIILDGRRMGVSPPLQRLEVTAGVKHRIEIHGPGLPHYWTVELAPGERREIRADFERQTSY